MGVLDFIFPKKCVNCKKLGDYLCTNCFSRLSYDTKNICIMCDKPAIYGATHPKCVTKTSVDGQFSGIVFNKPAQKLIYSFKYNPYLSDLKEFLGNLLYEALIQKEEFNLVLKNKDIVFVPIPLFSSKFKKRGYNQAEILAGELSKKFGFLVLDALGRVSNTKTQTNLNRQERAKNVKDVFVIKNKSEILNKNIFLVDDVLTSGANLKEATKVLKRAGVDKVWAITLAQD